MARQPSRRGPRTRGRAVAALVALLGLAVALVFVRLALDWSDSLPYEGAVTEARYIVFMLVAVALVTTGVVMAVVLWTRAGRR